MLRHTTPCRKRRPRPRQRFAAHYQELQPRVPRDLAERDDDLQVRQVRDFVREMGEAAIDFLGQRLVVRRRATNGRRDIGIRQLQPIVDALRGVDVREAGALQRGHQEIARRADPVARKDAPRPVRAMRGRRQAENQDARLGIAKARDRPRPIQMVPERRLPGPAHLPAIGPQPRALLAANDGGPERPTREEGLMWCRCNMLQAGGGAARLSIPFPSR